jgi:biopolymer transport protein ExbD
MAISGIEGNGGKRPLDAELNMVPMIDLLMCCITFLLLTAVWSTMSRLPVNASLPGGNEICTGDCVAKERLHLVAREGTGFRLEWRSGNAVVSTEDVPWSPEVVGEGRRQRSTHPALRRALDRQWAAHPAPADPAAAVVVHVDHTLSFGQMASILDAVQTPSRDGQGKVHAYQAVLAQN